MTSRILTATETAIAVQQLSTMVGHYAYTNLRKQFRVFKWMGSLSKAQLASILPEVTDRSFLQVTKYGYPAVSLRVDRDIPAFKAAPPAPPAPINVRICMTDSITGEDFSFDTTLPELTGEHVALAIDRTLADCLGEDPSTVTTSLHQVLAFTHLDGNAAFILRSTEANFEACLVVGLVYTNFI